MVHCWIKSAAHRSDLRRETACTYQNSNELTKPWSSDPRWYSLALLGLVLLPPHCIQLNMLFRDLLFHLQNSYWITWSENQAASSSRWFASDCRGKCSADIADDLSEMSCMALNVAVWDWGENNNDDINYIALRVITWYQTLLNDKNYTIHLLRLY